MLVKGVYEVMLIFVDITAAEIVVIELEVPCHIGLYEIILPEIMQRPCRYCVVKSTCFQRQFEAITNTAASFDEAGYD